MRKIILHPKIYTEHDIKHALVYWDQLVIPAISVLEGRKEDNWGITWGPTSIHNEDPPKEQQLSNETNQNLHFLIQNGILHKPILMPFKDRVKEPEYDFLNWAVEKHIGNSDENDHSVLGFNIGKGILRFIKENPNTLLRVFYEKYSGKYPARDDINDVKNKIDIELYGVLPTPVDCSYEDILEFKHRRSDELNRGFNSEVRHSPM